MNDEHYEVDNPEIKALLLDLGRKLKKDMPEGWGFTLMIFEYGSGPGFFYLSSAMREDMIKMLHEAIDKLS